MVYHLYKKRGRGAAKQLAKENEDHLAELEANQNALERATLLANLDELIVADQAALQAASAAVASAQNQWARLVADTKAGLRDLEDPEWEAVIKRQIHAWRAYFAARESIDENQSAVAALQSDAQAGLAAILKATKSGQDPLATADDLALTTQTLNPLPPVELSLWCPVTR